MRPVLSRKLGAVILLVVCFFAPTAGPEVVAQSNDASYPTPLFSNEASGRIAPRDIGDARRTRHFYIFRGVEGDLVLTLESSELTGDVDVFTATTRRPLLKVTMYGGSPTRVSKSVYLRGEELLVLRVEARAVGDLEGSYSLRLEGAFAPAPAGLAQAPEPPSVEPAERRDKTARRVTSTGARIEEPPVETAAREEANATEEVKAEPTPTPAAGEAEAVTGRRESPAPRRARGTRSARNRARGRAATPAPAEEAAKTETAEEKPPATEDTAAEAKPIEERGAEGTPPPPRPARRGSSRATRRGRAAERAEATKPAEESTPAAGEAAKPPAEPSQRLIIVTKDGETLERDMNTVRRVTVDNNQLVILTRDGKTIRQPMANVLRMSIEP